MTQALAIARTAATARETYLAEKELGIRNRSGKVNLKRLKPKHLAIIRLHLEGFSARDIAQSVRCHPMYVGIVLRDPLARRILDKHYSTLEAEFNALEGKAVSVLREGMESRSEGTRLRAARIYLEEKSRRAELATEKQTAEDLVGTLVANFNTLVINQGGTK